MKYLNLIIKGKSKKDKKLKSRISIAITAILFLFVIFIFGYLGYSVAYANKIYPGITIAGIKVGGLTKKEALNKINAEIDAKKPEKAKLVYEDKILEINLSAIDLEFNTSKTTESIWAFGRRRSFLPSFKEHLFALVNPPKLDIVVSYDQNKFNQETEKFFNQIETPMAVYSFYLEGSEIKSRPGKEGFLIQKDKLANDLKRSLGNFNNEIKLSTYKAVPQITGAPEQVNEAKQKFETMIAKPLNFTFQNQKHTAEAAEIQKWAEFKEMPVSALNYKLDIELNDGKALSFIKTLSKKVNKEEKDAKLTIVDGRATVFQAEEEGYKLDETNTIEQIKEKVFTDNRNIALKVQNVQPKIRATTINNIGIKELISEGTSSFKGSPSNRIHNITIGANLFNGVLIPPDGTFSFNQVLGDVSRSKGFLPELVIKEDRLIPETGGGLCQVSTTMFRAAINAGIDITERTAHSFRVRYYEPPVGLDATVYQPKPDLKFKNDTAGYILIQTKISGLTLTFQFYGTKDGRTVKIDGPYTSGYRSPGAPVYIDDPSMPQGEIKQIEKAVPGLTAIVNWTVYRGGAILRQKTFVSKYVAWVAKYKKGTKAPEPPPAETPPAQ